jgi:hypothetical protein
MDLVTIALIVSIANGSAAVVLATLELRDRWRSRQSSRRT